MNSNEESFDSSDLHCSVKLLLRINPIVVASTVESRTNGILIAAASSYPLHKRELNLTTSVYINYQFISYKYTSLRLFSAQSARR